MSGCRNDCSSFETNIIFINLLHPRRNEIRPRVCVPVSISYRKKVKGRERNTIFFSHLSRFFCWKPKCVPWAVRPRTKCDRCSHQRGQIFRLATKKIHVGHNTVINLTTFQNSNRRWSKCANHSYIITQVIPALWLVLAYDLLEDRRIDYDSARFKFFQNFLNFEFEPIAILC